MIETKTILNERNINATKRAVRKKAKIKEESKLSNKYPVPFWNTNAFPVIVT